MNAMTLGNPNLFVKGMVEAKITDPTTGNIIGYDNVANESAITSSFNAGEVTGGVGNPVLINIPDSTRITGTLTSQAFSLRQRALMSGGVYSQANVSVPACKVYTADGTTLTIDTTPALSRATEQPASDTYGWCYVRPHGSATFTAQNYGVNLSTGEVQNFEAEVGKQYDVFYYVVSNMAESLELPSSFNPVVASLSLKYCVYAKQNNSVTNGTLQGYLYFIVPKAQFTGDAGLSGNQTSNSTTDYGWTAVLPDQNVMDCTDCTSSSTGLAYYLYVPCSGGDANITDIYVVGGGVSVAVGKDVQIPVKYYYAETGQSAVPTYANLDYVSATPAKATVSADGLAHGVSAGSSVVTITYHKSNGETLNTTCTVTVTST